MTKPHLFVGLALATVLGLGGCSGDDSPVSASATPGASASSKAPSTSTTTGPIAPPSAEASPTEGIGEEAMTAPGTTLVLDQAALLPVRHGSGTVVVRITVSAVDAGTSADLAGLGLRQDPDEVSPFQLRVSAELVSGEAGGLDPASLVEGIGPGGAASPLVQVAPPEACPARTFVAGATTGTSVQSCRTVVVPSGSEVTGARFSPVGTPYDAVAGAPVTWQ